MNINKMAVSPKTRLVLGAVLVGNLSIAAVAWSVTGKTSHVGQEKRGRKSTEAPIAGHGKLGQDIFLAIDHRDLAGVQALLKKGGDPNSRNGLEFTPLYIASASYQMDVMGELLKAGADADAESNYGTPLMFAAATGNIAGANILFSKGVNVNAVRNDGMSVLMMASYSGNPALVGALLEHKAEVNTKDDLGDTALMYAARQGHDKVAEILLGAGVEVDTVDNDHKTPLLEAAKVGNAKVVELLIAKGANVNAQDAHGMTPLMLAASYNDSPETIRALVKGGADMKATDAKGRDAMKLAVMKGNTAFINELSVGAKVTRISLNRNPRQAVLASLKLVQSSMGTFGNKTSCVSCHQEGLGRMATGMAKSKGFTLSPAVTKLQDGRMNGVLMALKPLHEQALKNPEVMKQVPLIEINEVNTLDTWMLAGMSAQKYPRNAASESMADVLARQQSKDGSWTMSLPRAPMQSSPFTFTALAVQCVESYGSKKESAGRIERARAWLAKAPAKNSEDRAGRILGLKWAHGSKMELAKAAKEIMADQRPDGGWAQLPGMRSDAYATGQALYALHEGGGVAVSDAAYQRGVRYLLRTQDEDGSWFVNKRAIPANNYFDGGFPHGQSQYSSFNGSCWAMMALMETL
ncbi:MAG: ankyrin repeat domain-containing protein [Armatimonadota bacterium]